MKKMLEILFLAFTVFTSGCKPAYAAYLTLPVNWSIYTAPDPVPVMVDSGEIFQIDLYRAWPLEEAYHYKTYINFLGGSYFEIPQEDLTCGEYSIVVTTTDSLLAVSELFYVQNERFLIKFMYPDEASVAGPNEKVLIKWRAYKGDVLEPSPESVSICIAPPKRDGECNLPPPTVERFGEGQAKWLVPEEVIRGYYQIMVVQEGQPGNSESTVVYIDPLGIIKPKLTLRRSDDMIKDRYTLQIGSGSPYYWALQYSFDGVHWFEYSEEYFRPNSTIAIDAPEVKSLTVRLRLH